MLGRSLRLPSSSSGWPSLLFGLVLLLLVPLVCWPQSSEPQTTQKSKYSTMTRDELLMRISEQDKLLAEWLTWSEKEKALKIEQEQAFKAQLASRDKMITDQGYVIDARTKERDQYKAALEGQKAADWVEKLFWGLGGAGLGYAAGHFTK